MKKILLILVLVFFSGCIGQLENTSNTEEENNSNTINGNINAVGSTELVEASLPSSECNYNNLCEASESDKCPDCQCLSGIVCNGLCFADFNNGLCVDGVLLDKTDLNVSACSDFRNCPVDQPCQVPGKCSLVYFPFRVYFDLPKFLELGKETSGRILFVNPSHLPIKEKVKVDLNGLEATDDENHDLAMLQEIELNPGQEMALPVVVKGTKISNGLKFNSVSQAEMKIKLEVKGVGVLFSYTSYVFDKQNAVKCGEYYWNAPGRCVGEIFFPGAKQ